MCTCSCNILPSLYQRTFRLQLSVSVDTWYQSVLHFVCVLPKNTKPTPSRIALAQSNTSPIIFVYLCFRSPIARGKYYTSIKITTCVCQERALALSIYIFRVHNCAISDNQSSMSKSHEIIASRLPLVNKNQRNLCILFVNK